MMAVLKLAWAYRKFVGAILGLVALYVLYAMWHAHVFTLGELKERAAWTVRWEARDKADADAIAAEKEHQRAEREANDKRNAQTLRDYNAQLLAIANDRDSLARRLREYETRLDAPGGAVPEAQGGPGATDGGGVAAGTLSADAALDAYDKACQRDAVKLNRLTEEVLPLVAAP
jgi:hypothetical protein